LFVFCVIVPLNQYIDDDDIAEDMLSLQRLKIIGLFVKYSLLAAT